MTTRRKAELPASQLEAFKQASRNLGAEESEEAFDRVLKKVGGSKPANAPKDAQKATAPPKRTKGGR